MDYQAYLDRTQQTTQLIKSGRLQEAVDALYKLILTEISDIDKAGLCVTLAAVYDRLGNTQDALDWYDKGIGYEQPYCRYEVAEKKAAYLSSIGHNQDAVSVYEALIKQPYLSEAERERVRKAVQMQLGKSMRQWK